MATIALPTKKKVIDLKGDTFRTLSVMAARKGTNLKKYIESILDDAAEDYDDSQMYAWLIENEPEGKIMLNEEEQAEFEKWLGI